MRFLCLGARYLIQLTYLFLKAHDLNVKYGRQFWKQCRDRGVCDVNAVRELRSRTLESESPMVSYLRVAEYHESLAEGHTTTKQWRSTIVLYMKRDARTFSKLEPSYPRYLILTKCRGMSCREKNSACERRNFRNNIRGEQAPGSQTVDFA